MRDTWDRLLCNTCVDLKRRISNHCLEKFSVDTYMIDCVNSPDSDHERWQKPIIIPKAPTPLEYFLEDDEGRIDVSVSAFVTTAVRPVQRWRRP